MLAVFPEDTIAPKLNRFEMAGDLSEAARRELYDRIGHMLQEGYDFEVAGGLLELLVREALHPNARPFEVMSYEVVTRATGQERSQSTASVSVRVQEGVFSATATRNGPVNALHTALRNCLSNLYPAVWQVKLTDYRVHILDPQQGTAARAQIAIEWTDGAAIWCTMGVSDNIIEASWYALVSAIRLELMRLGEQDHSILGLEDNSWAV
jgi:2-isopropylmalate synthase